MEAGLLCLRVSRRDRAICTWKRMPLSSINQNQMGPLKRMAFDSLGLKWAPKFCYRN